MRLRTNKFYEGDYFKIRIVLSKSGWFRTEEILSKPHFGHVEYSNRIKWMKVYHTQIPTPFLIDVFGCCVKENQKIELQNLLIKTIVEELNKMKSNIEILTTFIPRGY